MTDEIPGQLELPFEEFGGAFEHPLVPEPEPEPDALTAFLVVVDHTGAAVATSDLAQELTVERTATLADMRRACMEVQADIAALHTAEKVAEAVKQAPPPQAAQRVRQRLRSRGIQVTG